MMEVRGDFILHHYFVRNIVININAVRNDTTDDKYE